MKHYSELKLLICRNIYNYYQWRKQFIYFCGNRHTFYYSGLFDE